MKQSNFDRTNVPNDFLSGKVEELNAFISRLEGEISTQDSINEVYMELVETVRKEMVEKLKKVILIEYSTNKRRRFKNSGGHQI